MYHNALNVNLLLDIMMEIIFNVYANKDFMKPIKELVNNVI